MPLSTDKIPNFPLTGPEIKEYTLRLLHDELELRSVPDQFIGDIEVAMDRAMSQDFLFKPSTSYPLAEIVVTLRLHYAGDKCAFSVEPRYNLPNMPTYPKHSVFVRCGDVPPLALREGAQGCECFTLTAKCDNPNAIRVHFGMPIRLTRRIEPNPGEMFGSFKDETFEYDPATVPEPAAPVVTDESEEFSAKWGISVEGVVETMREIIVTPLPSDIEAGLAAANESPKRKPGRPRRSAE
jgi:hypothetical protein